MALLRVQKGKKKQLYVFSDFAEVLEGVDEDTITQVDHTLKLSP